MTRPPQLHQNPVTTADEIAECMRLKREGMTLRQIAAALGLSKDTVARRIDAGIAATVSTSVDALRVSETARLEALSKALASGVKAGEVAAISESRRIGESLRKLHGADAPTVSVVQLEQRTDLEANTVVEALAAALDAVFAYAGLDPAWQSQLTTFAFATAQHSLDPATPAPEPPRRLLAIMPPAPPDGPAADAGPRVPPWSPRPGDGLTADEVAILDAALLRAEEDDDAQAV